MRTYAKDSTKAPKTDAGKFSQQTLTAEQTKAVTGGTVIIEEIVTS